MTNSSGGLSNGIVPAVGALIVLLSGMYALTRPMDQRMSQLETQLTSVRELVERNQDKVSDQTKCITRSETELKEIDVRLHEIEDWQIYWNREVMANIAQMSEKIKTLERQAYGGVSPQISGE